MRGKARRPIHTGALLATVLFAACGPVIAATVTPDPIQGDGGVSAFYLWTTTTSLSCVWSRRPAFWSAR